MKTIEERAEEYQGKLASSFLGFPDLLVGGYNGYIKGATEQRELDYVQFQSFLSERGLLYGKYTKANGDTGYKTLDELWKYFHKEE